MNWDRVDVERVAAPYGGVEGVLWMLDRMGPAGTVGVAVGGVAAFVWRRRTIMAKDGENVTAMPGRNDALIGKILETVHEKLGAYQPPVSADPSAFDRRSLWRSVFDKAIVSGAELKDLPDGRQTFVCPDVSAERVEAAAKLATDALARFDAAMGGEA